MYKYCILLSLLLGCTTKEEVCTHKEYPQVCEMCGSEWMVYPTKAGTKVPPTIEWCFHDGDICNEGLQIMIENMKSTDQKEAEIRWLDHCFKCAGCRYATFKPKDWHEITDKLKVEN